MDVRYNPMEKKEKIDQSGTLFRIGVDVGGTFTDFVLGDGTGGRRVFKVLSTPDDPTDAVFEGMKEMAADAGLDLPSFLARVGRITHGTTVTTNAVLTGRTARTGLLTTKGFRDALQMRRGIREEPYDNKYLPPEPLVPRWLRRPVAGRIDRDGREIAPLVLDDVDAAAEALTGAGVEAVAICFMHAHANDLHERAAADRLSALMPGAYVSISSEILPQVRFYERTSTTVLNAAVGPILKRYLDRLVARLADAGFAGALLVMQSNGGVSVPAIASRRAAHTLLSGPAAGPVAGLSVAGRLGEDGFIVIDMGGTSFEASLVREGRPALTTSATVGRLAMALPSMDIKTIGAGGGSIAWIDEGGLLRMGPDSAGARPGPACYGFGGARPTCSDANLVLGYLSADYFADGRIALDAGSAKAAIDRHVARPLGLGTVEAAAGIHRIMNVTMASAIREISIERGHDPRRLPLICAGGAGGLHAAMIARELGIGRVLMPRDASVFCAAGMLGADLRHDLVRTCAMPLAAAAGELPRIRALLAGMEEEGRAMLDAEGVSDGDRRFSYALDLRYAGQYHEVRVEGISRAAIRDADAATIAGLFHERHDRLYGYALAEEGTGIELINIRVRAIGLTPRPADPVEPEQGPDPGAALKGERPVWFAACGAHVATPVYDGGRLRHGNRLAGPAIVETATTTLVVPEDFDLFVDAGGTAVLTDASSGRKE